MGLEMKNRGLEYETILSTKFDKHKLIKKLGSMGGKEFSNFSQFLFDYAVIAEGGTPKDPAKYLRQLDKYLS